MLRLVTILALTFAALPALAQSFYFGPKVGLDVNFQRWNNSERNSLITPNLDLFIESYDEEDINSLYALIGYHTKGSAVRFNFLNGSSGFDYRFNNLALGVGAKRVFKPDSKYKPYYILGLRLEYTVSTNLDKYTESEFAVIHPVDQFVNKFNYGPTIGIGFSKKLSDLIGGFMELAIMPDVSRQYEQPALSNIVLPTLNGRTVNIAAREIRNLVFEVTVGLRFLRKVEYY